MNGIYISTKSKRELIYELILFDFFTWSHINLPANIGGRDGACATE